MEKLDTKLKEVGPLPGTYVLVVELDRLKRIKIGRLGLLTFKTGIYLYIGSALGPGGLAGRIHRHLRPETQKRSHWHIDALTSQGSIMDIWWSVSSQSQECIWAGILSMSGKRIVTGFGSSDCRCAGHLVRLQHVDSVHKAWDVLREHVNSELYQVRFMETAI